MHRTYVGSVERGLRNVSLINLARIAEALGVTVSELCKSIDHAEAQVEERAVKRHVYLRGHSPGGECAQND